MVARDSERYDGLVSLRVTHGRSWMLILCLAESLSSDSVEGALCHLVA